MRFTDLKLPGWTWGGEKIEISLPQDWQIMIYPMRGWSAPKITPAEIIDALHNPVGSSRVRGLIKGEKEVAIIFDDISRPTRVEEISLQLVGELLDAGVKEQSIRFVVALGAHAPHTYADLRHKIGEEILARFPVFNHNPYENCTRMGETSGGLPIEINQEVASCDLKIGIGAILPHTFVGFSGGGKIVLPGVSSMESIAAHHERVLREPAGGQRWARQQIEEACLKVKLDLKIDCLINGRGETAAIFAGDPGKAYEKGIQEAQTFYATDLVGGNDVVIANASAKATEAAIAVTTGAKALKEDGDLVVTMNTPQGQVIHYLMGKFGTRLGGKLCSALPLPSQVARVIVFSPYEERASLFWFGPPEKVIWCKTWEEVLELLQEKAPQRAKVALYPDATIQYFR